MDTVSIETIIALVKQFGADAALDGDELTVYPADGNVRVYIVPPGGLRRRVIIEIGQRTGVASHLFWNPERALASASKERPATTKPA